MRRGNRENLCNVFVVFNFVYLSVLLKKRRQSASTKSSGKLSNAGHINDIECELVSTTRMQRSRAMEWKAKKACEKKMRKLKIKAETTPFTFIGVPLQDADDKKQKKHKPALKKLSDCIGKTSFPWERVPSNSRAIVAGDVTKKRRKLESKPTRKMYREVSEFSS